MWKDTRITGVLQEKELKPSPAAKRKWNSTLKLKVRDLSPKHSPPQSPTPMPTLHTKNNLSSFALSRF